MNGSGVSGKLFSAMVFVYRLLLVAYPKEYRRAYGAHMAQLFGDQAREVRQNEGAVGLVKLGLRTLLDLAVSVLRERGSAALVGLTQGTKGRLYRQPVTKGKGLLVFGCSMSAIVLCMMFAYSDRGLLEFLPGLLFWVFLALLGAADLVYASRRRQAALLRAAAALAAFSSLALGVWRDYPPEGLSGIVLNYGFNLLLVLLVVYFVLFREYERDWRSL